MSRAIPQRMRRRFGAKLSFWRHYKPSKLRKRHAAIFNRHQLEMHRWKRSRR